MTSTHASVLKASQTPIVLVLWRLVSAKSEYLNGGIIEHPISCGQPVSDFVHYILCSAVVVALLVFAVSSLFFFFPFFCITDIYIIES